MSKYVDITAITQVIGTLYNHPELLDEEDKYKIYEEDIMRKFYIQFGEQILCGEIIHPQDLKRKTDLFIFIHPQTKDVEIDAKTPLYTDEFTTSRYHVRFLKDRPTPIH